MILNKESEVVVGLDGEGVVNSVQQSRVMEECYRVRYQLDVSYCCSGSCSKSWRQKLDFGVKVEVEGIDFFFLDIWYGREGNKISVRESGCRKDFLEMLNFGFLG